MKIFGRNKSIWDDGAEDIDNGFGGYDGGVDDDADNYGYTDEASDAPVAPAAPSPSFNANPVSLKIVSPKAYTDAQEITEFLMNGNTILINIDGMDREVALRVMDYLRGATQVVGGMITRVGKTTVVVAPKNVDVSSIEAMVGSAE